MNGLADYSQQDYQIFGEQAINVFYKEALISQNVYRIKVSGII